MAKSGLHRIHPYRKQDMVAASDHAVCELLKTIGAGRQEKFNAAKVLGEWAKAHGIKDVKSFVREVRPIFEAEILVRGLTEGGRSQPLREIIYCEGNPCHHCNHHEHSDACEGCPHQKRGESFLKDEDY